ncbi:MULTISPECIES: hypothetical protein [unclassified Methylobacterium]
MGRGVKPDDISGAIAVLASQDAHFVTGENGRSMAASRPRTASRP